MPCNKYIFICTCTEIWLYLCSWYVSASSGDKIYGFASRSDAAIGLVVDWQEMGHLSLMYKGIPLSICSLFLSSHRARGLLFLNRDQKRMDPTNGLSVFEGMPAYVGPFRSSQTTAWCKYRQILLNNIEYRLILVVFKETRQNLEIGDTAHCSPWDFLLYVPELDDRKTMGKHIFGGSPQALDLRFRTGE